MDGLEIDGGKPLHGDIIISGAKNAALPLLCLGLITDAPLILENVPELADTISMEGLPSKSYRQVQVHFPELMAHR